MSPFAGALEALRSFSVPLYVHRADVPVGEEEVLGGLREIARVRRELDLLQAECTSALKAHRGRDTTAAVARTMKSSTREARNAAKVGAVLDTVTGAREALLAGDVTNEHLRALAPICADAGVEDLLTIGAQKTPEEFAQAVTRYRINKDPDGWRQRQHKARSVRFFDTDDGCLGMIANLPTTTGARIKQHLRNMVDTQWRRDHPERARVRGGHGGDTQEQRLADALVEAILGRNTNHASTGHNDVTTDDVTTDDVTTDDVTTDDADTNAAGSNESATKTTTTNETASKAKPVMGSSTPRTTSRVDLVVTIDAATLEAEIVGHGPIPLADALDLAPQAQLYAMIHDTNWGNLKLGRNRRIASPLQRLAVMIRDRGRCSVEGCDEPADRCDVHHFDHFAEGGNTDIDVLGLLCRPSHHPHEHETTRHIRTKRKPKPRTRKPRTRKPRTRKPRRQPEAA